VKAQCTSIDKNKSEGEGEESVKGRGE